MKTPVTETIFSNQNVLIPMASVQHIEKRYCPHDGKLFKETEVEQLK